MLRIVGGKYKRSILETLEGNDTRPTKEMVREALFSSLGPIDGTIFLDLFSGSGAVGIEALSRGAKEAVFNDQNKRACRIITNNLKKLNLNEKVYESDWRTCLLNFPVTYFDFIFLDPPYNFGDYAELLRCCSKILKDKGKIILEVKTATLNPNITELEFLKEKKYGISKLLFYKK